ncbi:MAG TPA: sigma 54-interacting transcriptional regulator [Gemmataceae bacterium]|nr:sigma 54-interacting transcriptional regulator [Gemmataceae bacterium]
MALFQPAEQRFADNLSRLIYSNPFLPERIELERTLLGADYVSAPWVYHKIDELDHEHPNLTLLDERVEKVVAGARERLAQGIQAGEAELALYADLATYLLYRRFRAGLLDTVARGLEQPTEPPRVPYWKRFAADFKHFVALPGLELPGQQGPAYLLACFFQVRRAFYQIYHHIAGASRPVTKLRGTVWQSIFTHNMERYFRLGLHQRMGRFPTLITGPSGTGKELVARAIGLSRFIPFDPDQGRFTADVAGSFHALNISALAPSLVESELFGHAKGAFTGATRDQAGWLDKCPELGSVFLDEIGELDPGIQVKLLRVLEDRKFHRLGETAERRFRGKILAATNRDLAAEMQAGRFREDLFYRLCGDLITTPSLAEQLRDRPEDLADLLRLIVKRVTADEVHELAGEVEEWIKKSPGLGSDYAWPGNFRELEQCAWNVLIRKEYHPPRMKQKSDPADDLAEAVRHGTLSVDELERRYATLVFAKTASYQETSRRLGWNWRTVKSKIDPELLRQIRSQKSDVRRTMNAE